MGLWAAFRKSRAIRSYFRVVPEALLDRYGFVEGYSPEQVLATLATARLSLEHADYACALFSAESDFVAWVVERRASRSTREQAQALYRRMRSELADVYNNGRAFKLKAPRKDFDDFYPIRVSRWGSPKG